MSLPVIPPEPLRVVCDTCAAEGFTFDYQHPDLAVECSCCPLPHDHAGIGCRPVTIYATAYLTMLDPAELLDVLADTAPLPDESPVKAVD